MNHIENGTRSPGARGGHVRDTDASPCIQVRCTAVEGRAANKRWQAADPRTGHANQPIHADSDKVSVQFALRAQCGMPLLKPKTILSHDAQIRTIIR